MSKKKKGLDLDTQKIVAWCKSNVVLVILIVVSIGAIVGLPRLGVSWAEQVEDSLRQRAKNFSKLDALTKTSVTPPGSSSASQVTINQALVDEYAAVASSLRGDAEQVVEQATEMNQKEYAVLFTEDPNDLFPNPSKSKMETLPQQFCQQLELEYSQLLQTSNAGTPISRVDLASYLEDARVAFMETNLSKPQDAGLTSEQRSSLEKHLSKLRMKRLRTNAEDISLYLREGVLDIPLFDHKAKSPPVEELFGWQWRYWVVADTIGAIASINAGQSVLTSPIKRVVSIEVMGIPALEDDVFDEDSGESQPPPSGFGTPPDSGGNSGGGLMGGRGGSGGGGLMGGRGGSGGGGLMGGRGGSGGGGNSGGSGRPPKSGSSSSNSFTGRTSGDLIDLVKIRLRCVVDTERIPTILDGFARHNFFTVIDLDLWPANKFLALVQGFDYGPASVSELTVVFETVWLRSWTTEYMPDTVKNILGIQVDEE